MIVMIENISTLPDFLLPIASSVDNIMTLVQLIVGGVFGLYLIIFIWRLWDSYKTRRILINIKKDILSLKAAIKRIETREKQEYKDKLNELINKTDSSFTKLNIKKTLKNNKK